MKRLLLVFLVLSLVLPILLSACGSDDNEGATTLSPTATPTVISTATSTITATPTSLEPVRIGSIYPRSGAFAAAGLLYDPVVSLVEWQVKNQGGILGGREVKFVKGDDRGAVAEAAAQAKKLILDENISILTFGGVSGASFDAVASVAEEYKVPYVALASLSNNAKRQYCADTLSFESSISSFASHIEFLKPKTIAHLSYDITDTHRSFDGFENNGKYIIGLKERFQNAGMDLIYDEYYPGDTVDFTPYITKIKYLNPDLLFAGANNPGNAIALVKQIKELGGLGKTVIYFSTSLPTSFTKRPEAVGIYIAGMWIPGSGDPGMQAFGDAFMQKYEKQPDSQTAIGYNVFWTAIKAIELAGTDNPETVAQALRSGNLDWYSAFGHLRIGNDGGGIIEYPLAQVQEGGKLVKVWP